MFGFTTGVLFYQNIYLFAKNKSAIMIDWYFIMYKLLHKGTHILHLIKGMLDLMQSRLCFPIVITVQNRRTNL